MKINSIKINTWVVYLQVILISALMAMPLQGFAFDSGSTGADGVFTPTANIELPLPPSGIFNFSEVNIPNGVTVTFAKNAGNTPVTLLVSGDFFMDGGAIIDVNGSNGNDVNDLDFRGKGGPGGFDGGRGGLYHFTLANEGGDGQGPGRGTGGYRSNSRNGASPGGGSFGSVGQNGNVSGSQGLAGPLYGNDELLPLIGGSGGGGASGGDRLGAGGGGGGGAILIAVTGTATIHGTITARGGSAGVGSVRVDSSNTGVAASGSGGAIRIVATTLQGNGPILANRNTDGIDGGDGRIRLEAETMLRGAGTNPAYTFSTPRPILVPNFPSIRISNVGGNVVPAIPTGFRDVELPGVTINPVSVDFETVNVPVGTIILLTAAPERGTAVTANSNGVAADGTDSTSINLPNGNSLLTAQTTFTVVAELGIEYSKYAQGEQVEKVKVAINSQGMSETTFITISGKEFTWPSNAIAMN